MSDANRDLGATQATGFLLFKDGNAWCAVAPGFQNIMQSPCGFGETQGIAYGALIVRLDKNSWWREQPDFPPPISKFTVRP